VRWLALVLGGLAIVAWAAWQWANCLPASEFLKAWMPNFGTDFLLLAFGLLVVERLQKQQEKQRKRPLVDWIWQEIGAAIDHFAIAAEYDYTQTHARSNEPAAAGTVGALMRWRDGLETEDSAREDLVSLIEEAESLSAHLDVELVRELDCPDLIPAILRYVTAVKALPQGGDAQRLAVSSKDADRVTGLLNPVARSAVAIAEIRAEFATRTPGIVEGASYRRSDLRILEMLRTRVEDPKDVNRRGRVRAALALLKRRSGGR
jgi:hypothetical protein